MGPYFLMRLQFGRRVEFLNFDICSSMKTQYLEKAPLFSMCPNVVVVCLFVYQVEKCLLTAC